LTFRRMPNLQNIRSPFVPARKFAGFSVKSG
jgi:hypothetical protein